VKWSPPCTSQTGADGDFSELQRGTLPATSAVLDKNTNEK
jgi:hypothetical protein